MEIFKHSQAESVMANTQLLLRKTFDALQEAVFIIDAKTVQITDCNSAASEMFGYSRKEMLGQTTSFLHVNEAELQKFRDLLSLAVRERGHLYLSEFQMKRKNGDIFKTDHSVMPLEDDRGDRIGWVSVIRDITERRRAEEALRLARFTVDNVADAVYWMDSNAQIVDVNETACSMLGYTREELLHFKVFDIDPDFTAEKWTSAWDALKSRGKITLETKHRTKDGRLIPVEIMANYLRFGGKELDCAFARDISDRKRTEEALRASKKRFRSLVESTSDWVWEVDQKGVYTYVSPQILNLLGYAPEEVIGKKPFDLMPNDEAQRIADIFNSIAADKKPIKNLENINRHKDGRLVVLETSGIPFYDSHGDFGGYRGIDRDITERKLVEDALRESENRFHTFMDNSPTVAWMKDEQGRYIYVNKTLEERFEKCRADWVDKTDFDIWPTDVAERFRKNDIAALEGGQTIEVVEEAIGASGESSSWWIFKFPVLSTGGRRYVGGIGIDITELKRVEEELKGYRDHLEALVDKRTEELRTLNDQLRQAQKLEAVGILAGGIAHEFSNILATMKGSVYLIQKKLPEDSPVMRYAEQVLASMKKANTLSQGLLAFSRKQKISLKSVHFNDIIQSGVKMLGQLIGENIELAVRLTDMNPTVLADMNQIEQVLINLVTNARDAMPTGGRLSIGTDVIKMDDDFKKQHGYGVSGEYVVLTVSDSGTGIDEAVRGNIFEPFFTTKVVGKGSGLGLAVTYGIVKQHKGFIDVESIPGEGTTFKLYFPTVIAEVIQPVSQAISLPVLGSETVLLAEDDEDARAIMGELLRMSGYTVLEAGDGEEAIRVYKENKDTLQLVCLDVRMPKKNGREVYEEIKRMHPATKFLFMSGYTADIMDSIGVSEEGIDFISKAASPDEILGKIREVLDQ